MRIVHVIATLLIGGAEKLVTDLAIRHASYGHEVFVVAITHGGPYEDAPRRSGISVTVLGKRWKIDPFAAFSLVRTLRLIAPDIVHSHMFTANAYVRAGGLLFGKKPAFVATEASMGTDKTSLKQWIDRRLSRRTFAIVCPSIAVKNIQIARGIPETKLRVIHNAVFVADIANRVQALRAAEKAPRGEGRKIVTVARLDPEKDLKTLIEAVALLRKTGGNVALTIVGDGPDRPALERAADAFGLASDGTVRFAGRQLDVTPYLAEADIFCLPSITEGLPLAILEAFAAGLPVVASRIDAHRELIVEDESGVLFEPGSAKDLADKLSGLLTYGPRAERIAAAGEARVRERFDFETCARAYESLYAEALSCPSP